MSDKNLILPVTEIQRFCMHDGPGIRTVVFLKGCPLRCAWCHNPETQQARPQMLYYESKCIHCGTCAEICIQEAQLFDQGHQYDRAQCIACGRCADLCCTQAMSLAAKHMSIEEIVSVVMRDVAFYGDTGGVTVSGGEPMMHPEQTLALLSACKNRGISTVVESCGYFESEFLPELCRVTDLFLWDIKDTDSERHRRYTGVTNHKIIERLLEADGMGARTRLRCILVNGINTNLCHAEELVTLYHKLKHCEGVEFLPYHAYGGSKMIPLGLENNGCVQWIPTNEQIAEMKKYLVERGVVVF